MVRAPMKPAFLLTASLSSFPVLAQDDLKKVVALQQAQIAAQQAQIEQLLKTPRALGAQQLPVHYDGSPAGSWTNVAAAGGIMIDNIYSDQLRAKDELQMRLCFSRSDTCTPEHGALVFRLAKLNYGQDVNVEAVYQSSEFGITWSGSSLHHHDCSAWSPVPANLFQTCNGGWTSTCVLEAKRTTAQACRVVIPSARIEWRAVGR